MLALDLDHIVMRRGTTLVLDDISFSVGDGERWLILGANGSGKTSLLRVAALYDHPTSGTVEVLGERLGRTDVRELRRRVGYASAALADQLRPSLRVLDAVRTARFAALEPWWHRYTGDDDDRARACLERMGVGRFAERPLESLSSGERQRVLLARTLMTDPAIVLLDEPSARLDLGGREQLVHALDDFAADRRGAATRRRHPPRRRHPDEHDTRPHAPRGPRPSPRPDRRGARRRRPERLLRPRAVARTAAPTGGSARGLGADEPPQRLLAAPDLVVEDRAAAAPLPHNVPV